MKKKAVVLLGILLLALSVSGIALGGGSRDDGTEPYKIIVPYAESGGTDTIARAISSALEKELDGSVVVENRLGGSGAVGMVAGAASIPDGKTLTMVTRELVSLPAMGLAQISVDDFRLLGLINLEAAVLVVDADSPYRSLDDLIAAAKRAPGKIRFASAAKPHFYILEFEILEEISFNKIPYNGAAMAIPAVVEGGAEFTLANLGELKSWLDAGEVRALGIMDDRRAAGLESVPTFREMGIDIHSYTWRGLAVPADTPDAVCLQLERAVERACVDEQFVRTMEEARYKLHYMPPVGFKKFIEEDEKTIGSILKSLNSRM